MTAERSHAYLGQPNAVTAEAMTAEAMTAEAMTAERSHAHLGQPTRGSSRSTRLRYNGS
jgi:hypothetical protein